MAGSWAWTVVVIPTSHSASIRKVRTVSSRMKHVVEGGMEWSEHDVEFPRADGLRGLDRLSPDPDRRHVNSHTHATISFPTTSTRRSNPCTLFEFTYKTMCGWDALPAEIKLLVAYELHRFQDLIAMFQTCKSAYSLNSNRSLWTKYLECLCREHHIFLPSWNISTATLAELRSLSSRPTRFERAIREGRLSQRSPIHLHAMADHEIKRHYSDAKLIPGGRWLVTVGKSWLHNGVIFSGLDLWEIGHPVAKTLRLVETIRFYEHPRPNSLEIWEDRATNSYIIALVLLDFHL